MTPSQKHKKLRHRRVGSGGGGSSCMFSKSSPVRDRRQQDQQEQRKSRLLLLVDSQTQTDQTSIMDMSETDASPSPFATSRELAMCLRDSGRGRSIEDLNIYGTDFVDAKMYDTDSPAEAIIKNEEYTVQQTSVATPAASSPLHSPNGNSMSKSDLTYQDACSSPDLLDDAMNSNDRLEDDLPNNESMSSPSPPHRNSQRRSSRGGNRHHRRHHAESEDNLEQLDRQVNAFFTENRRSIQSSNSENGNNAPAMMTNATTTTTTITTAATTEDSLSSEKNVTTAKIGERLDIVDDLTMRRGFIHMNKDSNEVTVIRCTSSQDEFCNDSWTDEEGEDPDNQYSWRRKR